MHKKAITSISIAAFFLATFVLPLSLANGYQNLPQEYQEKLNKYAKGSMRYFTSEKSNNKLTGLPHAFFGSGKFQVFDGGQWREEQWDLTRGYGSHINMNESTLKFLSLAVGYKMEWLDYLPLSERYSESWDRY